MIFQYFDMLSGCPIEYTSVGHIRSPQLKELTPEGIGGQRYKLYLNILSSDKNDLVDTLKGISQANLDKLLKYDDIDVFDMVRIMPHIRSFFLETFDFFLVEKIEWSEEDLQFKTYITNENNEKVTKGTIDKTNFENVRTAMLEMNFIFTKKDEPKKYESAKAKELWEKAQEAMTKIKKQSSNNEKNYYQLDNIVSKFCIIQPNYNIKNVFELTVFQLYDQFFQARNIRTANLTDMIFAIHGGEKYDFESWMKPTIKI